MNETTTSPTNEVEAPVEKKLANIVRGQIPVTLVYLIRFHEQGNKEADIAKRYGTTGGKVADILKSRNFAYVGEDFAPTAEQKTAAVEWLKNVPNYDDVGTDAIVTQVEGLTTATAEQAAAFLAARSGSRQRTPKEPKAVTEGGEAEAPAPKRGKKAKAEAVPADADALLS